jgi:hypothetical protein
MIITAIALLASITAAQAQTVPAPDTARAAIATRLAAKILPDGVYRQMFSSVFDQMGNGMMMQMLDIPLRDFAALAGEDGEQMKAKMGPGTIKEVMQLIDPVFEKRTQAMFKAMEPGFTALFTKFEPVVRDGLAIAYANTFDESQLKELEAFFATPTGSAYASQSMTIFMDPSVMEKMMGVMPEMMKAMPEIMKPAIAEMAKFPKVKTAKDLTPAERKKLAELLGIPEDKLK